MVTIDIQSVILLKNTLKKYLFLFFKNYFWDQHIKTI